VIRQAVLLLLPVVPLFAGDALRSKASDYPAHAVLPGFEIGAEYLVHSIPADTGYYFADDYLVVEVAVFPTTREGARISIGQFTLRINRGKSVYSPDSPGTVAASLKYPDWEQRPRVEADAGPITIGSPTPTGRFPGDPRQSQPFPNPAGRSPDTSGMDKEPRKSADQNVVAAALPEGPSDRPVKGCLFFRYKGKSKKIHSLELVYDGGQDGPQTAIPLV